MVQFINSLTLRTSVDLPLGDGSCFIVPTELPMALEPLITFLETDKINLRQLCMYRLCRRSSVDPFFFSATFGVASMVASCFKLLSRWDSPPAGVLSVHANNESLSLHVQGVVGMYSTC